jgi:hypothetical protein
MNFNTLGEYFYRFPGILTTHSLKLSEVTDSKAVELSDEQMLVSDQAYPNKFEMEMIRFWRKKGLLPFFEDGKHARISLAQLMWLRFLSELRNISSGAPILIEAHDFLIKRAYDDNLALKNLIALEDDLKKKIDENAADEESKNTLAYVKNIQADPLLLYSLKMDINYFTMSIMDIVINHNNVAITYGIKKEFTSPKGHYESKPFFEIVSYNQHQLIENPSNPNVTLPINFFVKEVFEDCNLSENAFNIQILNEKEKELFSLIREKRVNEVKLFSSSDFKASNTYQILKPDGNYNAADIKQMKYILCTKFYHSGIALLNDGSSDYPFYALK